MMTTDTHPAAATENHIESQPEDLSATAHAAGTAAGDGQASHMSKFANLVAGYPPPIRDALLAAHELTWLVAPLRSSEWAHLDLTMGQFKTLMTLASQPGMGITQLAETLNVSKPTASTLVDQLVQSGYARRVEDPVDRRRAIVTPTAEGDDLVDRLRQDRERLTRWIEKMHLDDLAALTHGLQALVAIGRRDSELHSSTTEPTEHTEHTEHTDQVDHTGAGS